MNVHDQLIYARHEEPPRAAARTRREAQTLRARRAASPGEAGPDSRPGPAESRRASADLRRPPAIDEPDLRATRSDAPGARNLRWPCKVQ